MKQHKTYWTIEEQEFFTQKDIAEMATLNFKTFQRWSKAIGLKYKRGLIHKNCIPEILEKLRQYGESKATKNTN